MIDATAAAAAAVQAGPLRLFWGNGAWGLQHIETNAHRVAQIRKRGFVGAFDFADAVAKGWTALHAGPGPQKLTAVLPGVGALALKWNAGCWSITTMLPYDINYPKLYEK